jgi:hypothetical protein
MIFELCFRVLKNHKPSWVRSNYIYGHQIASVYILWFCVISWFRCVKIEGLGHMSYNPLLIFFLLTMENISRHSSRKGVIVWELMMKFHQRGMSLRVDLSVQVDYCGWLLVKWHAAIWLLLYVSFICYNL